VNAFDNFTVCDIKSAQMVSTLFVAVSIFCIMFAALVAELRMLSSGESSAMVSNPTIVKSQHHIKTDSETLTPTLLEPGMLFREAYPDSFITSLSSQVFGQLTEETDMYRWKSLGYWLCSRLMSVLSSSDIFCQTFALKLLTDQSAAFLDSLHGIRQRYFIAYGTFVLENCCIVGYTQ